MSSASSPLRILHVVGGLANSSGTTHIILNLARDQVAVGHEVSVFYVSGRTADTVSAPDPRIDVRAFPLTALRRWAWSVPLERALRREVSRYDVVHVHSLWLHVNLAVWRACTSAGVPYMVAPQGTLDHWTLGHHGWRKALYAAVVERRILDAAGAIQAVSPREMENVRAFSVRAPAEVVPNGVDTGAFDGLPTRQAARSALQIHPEAEVVLYLSRLHPKKGVELLLEAMALVARDRPSALLLLGGSDAGTGYARTLEQRVERLGLGSTVRATGELRGAQKRAALAAADVFVLPSHSEGLPVAALEALAAGLPVLLSPGCYLPEAAEWGAGLVIPREEASWRRALRDVLADAGMRKRMGASARRLALERFSSEAIAGRLEHAYRRMIDRARCVPLARDASRRADLSGVTQ